MTTTREACKQCDRPAVAKGLCSSHYQAKRLQDQRAGLIPTKKCTEPDCGRPLLAKGLCASHYNTKRNADQRAEVRSVSRPCEGGCGADLAGRPPNAKYCGVVCKERVHSQLRKAKPDYHAERQKRAPKDAARQRERILRWTYGITAEEYDGMLADQDGRCAICQQPPDGIRLSVDHNHSSGSVRGLLCNNCNNGLGRFGDDPVRLRAAIAYLEGSTS